MQKFKARSPIIPWVIPINISPDALQSCLPACSISASLWFKKKCILTVQDNICSCPLICPPDVPLPTTDYPSGFLADLTEVLV